MEEARKMEVSIGLAMVALLLWAGETMAQSSDCSNVLISLAPCLNYINGRLRAAAPVVRSQPQCLCQVFDNDGGGINVNQTLALALPGACRLQTPPISRCNAASPINDSPAESPSGEPTEGGSRRNVPKTTENGTSNGISSTILLSKAMLFIFLVAATFAPLIH